MREKQNTRDCLSAIRSVHFSLNLRYEANLFDGKTIGVKKGLMLGITQAIVNIVLYGGIAIIFWYGPYLIRHECQNYTAGHFIVVRGAIGRDTVRPCRFRYSSPV